MKKLMLFLVLFLSSIPYSSDNKHTTTFNKTVYIRSHFIYNASLGIGIEGLDGEDSLSLDHKTLPTNPSTNPKVTKKILIGRAYPGAPVLFPINKNSKLTFKLEADYPHLQYEDSNSISLPHKLSVSIPKGSSQETIVKLENSSTSDTKDFYYGENKVLETSIESEINKETLKNKPNGRYSNISYFSIKLHQL